MFDRVLTFVAVLALAASAAAQPQVSEFVLLSGDDVSAAAAGHQRTPTAAKGNEYTLVVWFDQVEIHASRVNAEGVRVDEVPIVIARDRIDSNSGLPRPPTPPPAVAWNGQHWLVVYRGQTVSLNGGYFTSYLFAVRIAPDGTVVDQEPITIRRSEDVEPGSSFEPGHPAAAAAPDGGWVVAWSEYVDLWINAVHAHRISADGVLLTGEPLVLSSTTDETQDAGDPQLASAPDGFLLTVRQGSRLGSSHDTFGRRYDALMNPLAPFFRLGSADAQRYTGSRIARGPDEFLIVGLSSAGALYGFRMPLGATQPTSASGIALAAGSPGAFDVAHDGANWVVAEAGGGLLRVRRFGPTLAPVDPAPLPVPLAEGYEAPQFYYTVAAGALPGGGATVLWHDNAVPADDNVWSSRMVPGAPPEARRLVSGEIPTQSTGGVATAADGSGAVAFWSRTAARRSILVQRFGPDGAIIDAEPIEVVRYGFGTNPGTPDIAFNGSVYTIVWPAGSRAYARRMTPDGAFLDAAPVAVLPVNETSVVTMLGVGIAATGDTLLVAGYSRQSFNRPYVRYARVRISDMTVLDPSAPVLEFSINQLGGFSTPDVAVFGPAGAERFIIAFTDSPPAGEDNVDIAVVGVDGVSTSAGSIGSSGSALPTVAAIGDRALVVYRNTGADGVDLFGRLFTGWGIAETPETLILSAPGTQTNPRLASDGEGYLLAWSDFRHEAGENPLDPSFSDPWAARLDADGVSLDGTGFPLRVSETSELNVRLAAMGPGRYVAAYQALTPESPAVYRVGVQTIGSSGGPACAADWDGDGGVNSNDISAFLSAWLASVQGGTLGADFDEDGLVNSNDTSAFLSAWLLAVQNGC